jgi:outer membrane protein TolC
MRYLIVLLFLVGLSYGETVQELIKIAQEKNPELQSIQNKLKSYQYKQQFEGSLDDPVLSISINDIQLFNEPFNRTIEPMQNIMFGFSQKIPYSGKLDLKKEIVQKLYDSTYYKLLSKELKIKKDIYNISYSIWSIQEKLKIIDEYKQIVEQTINLSNTLYAVGKATQGDVLNAQVYYTQLLEKEIFLKNLKRQKLAQLKKIINSSVEDIEIQPEKPKQILNLSFLEKKLEQNNPEIHSIEKIIEREDSALKLAKKDYYPDFKMFFNYAYRQSFYDYISFGVAFNIPLWKKKRQDNKVLEVKYQKLSIQKKLKDKIIELKSKLEEQFYRCFSAKETYNLFETLLETQTEKNFEAVISEYEVGKKNMLDVLNAIKQILTVKFKKIDEVYDFNVAFTNIKELTGEL